MMHRTPRNTGFGLLLKAIEQIDADLNEAADNLGVDLPEYDAPEGMDAIVAAFQELEVDAAAQRCRQILEQAGRDFVQGKMPATTFIALEQRLKAASDAIARRSARLSPFGGS